MTKVKTFKNGAYTSFERDNARDYLRSFNAIAKNA